MDSGQNAVVSELHARAEESLARKHINPACRPVSDHEAVLHELNVRMAELEIRNEELKRNRCELEELSRRYLDLYQFAPIGYLTVDSEGRIVESNMAADAILGLVSRNISGSLLVHFVSPA